MAITEFLREFANAQPGFLKLADFITDYGNLFYHSIFILMMIIGAVKKDKKLLKIGLTYILVQVLALLIITGSLKIIVGRPRPGKGLEHHFFTSSPRFKSFPSGHATDAFSSAGVLWMFLKSKFLVALFFAYSLFIGMIRVFVGSHYFLDVLAGMTIGFLTGIILTRKTILKLNRERKSS